MAAKDCWILTDGKPGMENQCLGLADAIGLPYDIKRVRPRLPWRFLPPLLWPAPLRAGDDKSDTLEPPWPRLLIASGRQSAAPSIAIRRAAGGQTFTVQIQNPAVSPRHFDVVITPDHDRLSGPNVVSTIGALHRITPRLLAEEAAKFRQSVAALPRPLVVVLIGGSNKVYHMDLDFTAKLARDLKTMAERDGVGLLVTPSRRTGRANIAALERGLAEAPAIIWNGADPNPYIGWLGLADAVVVTADSVSMVSEACATGKPVFIAEPAGGGGKFAAFHARLREAGMTRRFDGRYAVWDYQPLDDTARAARFVAKRLKLLAEVA